MILKRLQTGFATVYGQEFVTYRVTRFCGYCPFVLPVHILQSKHNLAQNERQEFLFVSLCLFVPDQAR